MTSFLYPYTDNLLSFIFKMRETGVAVSVISVIVKVSQLSREFRKKAYTARHSTMRQFINVHGFVHEMGTHLSQRRLFTLQEILMYIWVICWKVDKGFSLQEASKSINISHKQKLKNSSSLSSGSPAVRGSSTLLGSPGILS